MIQKGTSKVDTVSAGSTKIDKIYKGDSLVYQSTNFVVLTIVAVPSDATITFEAPQESIIDTTENTITVIKETTVKYTVSANNYISQSGTVVVSKNQTINITLKTLSDEYDLLEWLGSDATSIINTGVSGGKNTYRIECKVNSGNGLTIAWYGNWSGVRVDNGYYYAIDTNQNCFVFRGYNPKASWFTNILNNSKGPYDDLIGTGEQEVVSSYTQTVFNGNTTTITPQNGTVNTEPIILFDYGLNARSKASGGAYFYYFKIYDSDVLILDLVPVRNKATQELGMYDKVSGKFLTDADPDAKGSGFTAGPVLS